MVIQYVTHVIIECNNYSLLLTIGVCLECKQPRCNKKHENLIIYSLFSGLGRTDPGRDRVDCLIFHKTTQLQK